MRYRVMMLGVAAWLALPATAAAQSLRQQCTDKVQAAAYRALCLNIADAMHIVHPRLGMALSGGNPVPGTASTLGMRLGALPRISLAGRVTAADVELPSIQRAWANTTDIDFAVTSVAADASVGLFQGFSILPTVGGFGSVDVLASIGIVPLPYGGGFHDNSPFTWAAGVRLGILRESFTAPGVSVSAMYRSLGDFEYGAVVAGAVGGEHEAFFQTRDYSAVSFRGVVGKRLLGFGVAGGGGYDRYRADVLIRVCDPAVPPLCSTIEEIQQDGLKTSRTSVFGNVSYTFLLVSLVAEAGWQLGGHATGGVSEKIEKGALFGGIAIRIGI